MFINFSNHPSDRWGEKQKKMASCYGTIVDIPFPAVDPLEDEAYIEKLSQEYVEQILKYQPKAVLCQGEFCLAYAVIQKLKENKIVVLAACSSRNTSESGNLKVSEFVFERFRQY